MTNISIIEKGWGLNIMHNDQLYVILITYNYAEKTFEAIAMDSKGDDVILNNELQGIVDDYTKHTILKEI
jgi:hypothetical protein